MVDAARLAPSVGNSQPWAFIVACRGDRVHARVVRHLVANTDYEQAVVPGLFTPSQPPRRTGCRAEGFRLCGPRHVMMAWCPRWVWFARWRPVNDFGAESSPAGGP
ncbi:nitroreductase family protein [Rhodococcus erythropolis]|uniref:nitroreductase family protein n=1 Tax=Rhodococcus erythropolis TaxID=1833 RepID=UPI0035589FBD